MVSRSQRLFETTKFKAAHIGPAALGLEVAEYVFGEGAGVRLFAADKCLMVHRDVKDSFDSGNFVILPVDAAELPIKR